jgi:hypothetical protein
MASPRIAPPDVLPRIRNASALISFIMMNPSLEALGDVSAEAAAELDIL